MASRRELCDTPKSMHKPLKSVDDLALFGAAPAFAAPLHVGRPNIGDRATLMARIEAILDRRWLTNDGPMVREFERAVADFLGVRHCVAMCNGTVALEIATRAIGMAGEVIVPSFTFVATAHALQWQEITPVFCDVEEENFTLDPAQVERMITPRTSGIIGVHLWGRPCDVDALADIAKRRKLKLMYDAAHAFGVSLGGAHAGRMIGSFGDAEVLSFHATKFINSFEGGAVVTDNDELAKKMRLMRNFGFAGNDNVIYIGTNGKMCEVSAAMGMTSLESIDAFIAVNHRNHDAYAAGLAGVPGVNVLGYKGEGRRNYQYVIVLVDADKAGLTRDELVMILEKENVLARRYFTPGCHRMEPYKSHFPHAGLLLPRTEKLSGCVLALPTGTAVDPPTIQSVCALIRWVVTHHAPVRARMKEAGHG